jgi:hypothetical protein
VNQEPRVTPMLLRKAAIGLPALKESTVDLGRLILQLSQSTDGRRDLCAIDSLIKHIACSTSSEDR